MDCVEVLPLDKVLRRSERGVAQRGDGQGAARLKIMGAPETPSLPRTVRERLERDEIGELLLRPAPAINFGAILTAIMSKKKVPETPDAVLQLIRTSPLRAHRLKGE
jgi:hypothetical protein